MNAASHRRLWQLAWPIMLANAAAPLLGLVDTAVIGHAGTVAQLGALALGALIFSFVYWAFGFLRMGTTGFVAHSVGRNDPAELRAAVFRALLLGFFMGLALAILRAPLSGLSLDLFSASAAVESEAATYLSIRLLGAPASLAAFALSGALIGLGKTREVLAIQLLMNGLNIILDVVLAYGLTLGITGIAWGTVLAEWSALFFAWWRVKRILHQQHTDTSAFFDPSLVFDLRRLHGMLQANGNIFLRTLTMLLCFGVFTNGAATYGDSVLAANHILLQFISLSAYVLDGYAHAAEPLVGRSLASNDIPLFRHTLKHSLQLALASCIGMAAVMQMLGPLAIDAMTSLPSVRLTAEDYLSFAAVYVLVSGLAFQMDGIFIGAAATRQMRNMALLSGSIFLGLAAILSPLWGYTGLWSAFIAYVLVRGLSLSLSLKSLTPTASARGGSD